jgi:hypothetical protein
MAKRVSNAHYKGADGQEEADLDVKEGNQNTSRFVKIDER